MEYKSEKDMDDGREPIEKILSDLNGLLNKMPSILSDIKTPDITKKNKFDYIKEEDSMFDDDKEFKPQENLNADKLSDSQNIPETSQEENVSDAKIDDLDPDENLDFMAFENDSELKKNIEDETNEDENPARTGFPPFETVPTASALEKEDDSNENESDTDSGAPDIEALMKLAESESNNKSSVAGEEAMEDKPSDAEQAMDDKPVDIEQGDKNESLTTDEVKQEAEMEGEVNLPGGVMNADEENKEVEGGNEGVKGENAGLQPVANLNPIDENPVDDEQDDEKTIIATPEDFKTMLNESASGAEQQDTADRPQPEGAEPQTDEQAMEDTLVEVEQAMQQPEEKESAEQAMETSAQKNIQSEDIQFESTVEASSVNGQVSQENSADETGVVTGQSENQEEVTADTIAENLAESEAAMQQPEVEEPTEQAMEDKSADGEQAVVGDSASEPVTEQAEESAPQENSADEAGVETGQPENQEEITADTIAKNLAESEAVIEPAMQQPEVEEATEQTMATPTQENIQAEDIQFEATVEAPPANAEQAMEDKPSDAGEEAMEDNPTDEEQTVAGDSASEPVAEQAEESAAQENIQAEDIQFEATIETPPANAEQAMEDNPSDAEQPEEAESGGLELNPSVELSAEEDDEKTIVLEPGQSAFSDNAAQSEQEIPAVAEAMANTPAEQEQVAADQTLSENEPSLSLVEPEQSSAEEPAPDAAEETIMAAPGDNPSETNRMKYTGSIKDLIEKPVPEEIPDERIKSLIFLYSGSDEILCAEVLNTIDAICLKSQTKPMFVKRPVVKICGPDVRGESAQALVAEHGAMGLICVGDLPNEVIYDIENIFTDNKLFFKHINKENFSHEIIVDIIADLILV